MNKKRIIVPGLALALILALGAYAINGVSADDLRSYSMIEKISERFGLNEDEVQVFFDEMREEHQVQREGKHDAALDQAVVDGVLTQEQRELLETKHDELRAMKGEYKDLSTDERKEIFEENRLELQVWAADNGIDLSEIHDKLGDGKRHKGFGWGRH